MAKLEGQERYWMKISNTQAELHEAGNFTLRPTRHGFELDNIFVFDKKDPVVIATVQRDKPAATPHAHGKFYHRRPVTEQVQAAHWELV